MKRPQTDLLREGFKDYISSLKPGCIFEKKAEIAIYKLVYSLKGIMLDNYITYFKTLVRNMRNDYLVFPDEDEGHPVGGRYVVVPLREKESASYYPKIEFLSLCFTFDGSVYTVYDFGKRA